MAENTKSKAGRSGSFFIRLAIIMLIITLVLTYLLTNLYAKYATADRNSDSARVAGFKITQEVLENGTVTKEIKIEMTPTDGAKTYTIRVESDSEISVNYTVKVENLTGNLPLEMKLDGSSVLEASGSFDVKSTTPSVKEYTFTVVWSPNADTNNFIYHREIDYISVTVFCEQKD